MKKIFLPLILGLIAVTATAEITLENSGAADAQIDVGGAGSLTLSSFDAGTAADTYVVVAVATKLKTDMANPVTSVTFGGTTLTKICEEFVDDTYEGWAILYGGALSGTGDVVANYTNPTLDSGSHEGIAFCVASYSDVSGTDAISAGVYDKGDPTGLTDSITTTNDNSLIVSCVMLGGPETFSQSGSTIIVQECAVTSDDKIDNALLSLAAPTAGTYGPDVNFSSQNRASMCSAELTEQSAPKATTFIVR